MNVPDQIKLYENRLKERGIRLRDVLDRAGVDRSTWTRWKGTSRKPPQLPSMSKWQAVEHEIEAALSRRANGNLEAAQ